MTTEVDLFNRQAQKDREIKERVRINDWHFDARCKFSSALTNILITLHREGYAIRNIWLGSESKEVLPGQTDAATVHTQSDDPTYQEMLSLVSAYKDAIRQRSGLEVKAGCEDGPQWLDKSHQDIVLGNNTLALPVETVNQNSHAYSHDPLNAGPQIHQAGVFVGKATFDPAVAALIEEPLKDLLDNPAMCEFAEADDLYAKSVEALKPFEARLRNLLNSMERHNLLPKPVPRIESPRSHGGVISIC